MHAYVLMPSASRCLRITHSRPAPPSGAEEVSGASTDQQHLHPSDNTQDSLGRLCPREASESPAMIEYTVLSCCRHIHTHIHMCTHTHTHPLHPAAPSSLSSIFNQKVLSLVKKYSPKRNTCPNDTQWDEIISNPKRAAGNPSEPHFRNSAGPPSGPALGAKQDPSTEMAGLCLELEIQLWVRNQP